MIVKNLNDLPVQNAEVNEIQKPMDLVHAAKVINEANQLATTAVHQGIAFALVCGKILAGVKLTLPARAAKGEGFDAWLKQNCPAVSKTAAYRYIGTYDRLKSGQKALIPDTTEGITAAGIERLKLPASSVTELYQEMGVVKKPVKGKKREKDGEPTSTPPEEIDVLNVSGALKMLLDLETWAKAMRKELNEKDRNSLIAGCAAVEQELKKK